MAGKPTSDSLGEASDSSKLKQDDVESVDTSPAGLDPVPKKIIQPVKAEDSSQKNLTQSKSNGIPPWIRFFGRPDLARKSKENSSTDRQGLAEQPMGQMEEEGEVLFSIDGIDNTPTSSTPLAIPVPAHGSEPRKRTAPKLAQSGNGHVLNGFSEFFKDSGGPKMVDQALTVASRLAQAGVTKIVERLRSHDDLPEWQEPILRNRSSSSLSSVNQEEEVLRLFDKTEERSEETQQEFEYQIRLFMARILQNWLAPTVPFSDLLPENMDKLFIGLELKLAVPLYKRLALAAEEVESHAQDPTLVALIQFIGTTKNSKAELQNYPAEDLLYQLLIASGEMTLSTGIVSVIVALTQLKPEPGQTLKPADYLKALCKLASAAPNPNRLSTSGLAFAESRYYKGIDEVLGLKPGEAKKMPRSALIAKCIAKCMSFTKNTELLKSIFPELKDVRPSNDITATALVELVMTPITPKTQESGDASAAREALLTAFKADLETLAFTNKANALSLEAKQKSEAKARLEESGTESAHENIQQLTREIETLTLEASIAMGNAKKSKMQTNSLKLKDELRKKCLALRATQRFSRKNAALKSILPLLSQIDLIERFAKLTPEQFIEMNDENMALQPLFQLIEVLASIYQSHAVLSAIDSDEQSEQSEQNVQKRDLHMAYLQVTENIIARLCPALGKYDHETRAFSGLKYLEAGHSLKPVLELANTNATVTASVRTAFNRLIMKMMGQEPLLIDENKHAVFVNLPSAESRAIIEGARLNFPGMNLAENTPNAAETYGAKEPGGKQPTIEEMIALLFELFPTVAMHATQRKLNYTAETSRQAQIPKMTFSLPKKKTETRRSEIRLRLDSLASSITETITVATGVKPVTPPPVDASVDIEARFFKESFIFDLFASVGFSATTKKQDVAVEESEIQADASMLVGKFVEAMLPLAGSTVGSLSNKVPGFADIGCNDTITNLHKVLLRSEGSETQVEQQWEKLLDGLEQFLFHDESQDNEDFKTISSWLNRVKKAVVISKGKNIEAVSDDTTGVLDHSPHMTLADAFACELSTRRVELHVDEAIKKSLRESQNTVLKGIEFFDSTFGIKMIYYFRALLSFSLEDRQNCSQQKLMYVLSKKVKEKQVSPEMALLFAKFEIMFPKVLSVALGEISQLQIYYDYDKRIEITYPSIVDLMSFYFMVMLTHVRESAMRHSHVNGDEAEDMREAVPVFLENLGATWKLPRVMLHRLEEAARHSTHVYQTDFTPLAVVRDSVTNAGLEEDTQTNIKLTSAHQEGIYNPKKSAIQHDESSLTATYKFSNELFNIYVKTLFLDEARFNAVYSGLVEFYKTDQVGANRISVEPTIQIVEDPSQASSSTVSAKKQSVSRVLYKDKQPLTLAEFESYLVDSLKHKKIGLDNLNMFELGLLLNYSLNTFPVGSLYDNPNAIFHPYNLLSKMFARVSQERFEAAAQEINTINVKKSDEATQPVFESISSAYAVFNFPGMEALDQLAPERLIASVPEKTGIEKPKLNSLEQVFAEMKLLDVLLAQLLRQNENWNGQESLRYSFGLNFAFRGAKNKNYSKSLNTLPPFMLKMIDDIAQLSMSLTQATGEDYANIWSLVKKFDPDTPKKNKAKDMAAQLKRKIPVGESKIRAESLFACWLTQQRIKMHSSAEMWLPKNGTAEENSNNQIVLFGRSDSVKSTASKKKKQVKIASIEAVNTKAVNKESVSADSVTAANSKSSALHDDKPGEFWKSFDKFCDDMFQSSFRIRATKPNDAKEKFRNAFMNALKNTSGFLGEDYNLLAEPDGFSRVLDAFFDEMENNLDLHLAPDIDKMSNFKYHKENFQNRNTKLSHSLAECIQECVRENKTEFPNAVSKAKVEVSVHESIIVSTAVVASSPTLVTDLSTSIVFSTDSNAASSDGISGQKQENRRRMMVRVTTKSIEDREMNAAKEIKKIDDDLAALEKRESTTSRIAVVPLLEAADELRVSTSVPIYTSAPTVAMPSSVTSVNSEEITKHLDEVPDESDKQISASVTETDETSGQVFGSDVVVKQTELPTTTSSVNTNDNPETVNIYDPLRTIGDGASVNSNLPVSVSSDSSSYDSIEVKVSGHRVRRRFTFAAIAGLIAGFGVGFGLGFIPVGSATLGTAVFAGVGVSAAVAASAVTGGIVAGLVVLLVIAVLVVKWQLGHFNQNQYDANTDPKLDSKLEAAIVRPSSIGCLGSTLLFSSQNSAPNEDIQDAFPSNRADERIISLDEQKPSTLNRLTCGLFGRGGSG